MLLLTLQYYVLIKQGKGMRKMHVALKKAGVLNVIQLEALGKSFFKDGNWLLKPIIRRIQNWKNSTDYAELSFSLTCRIK